MLNFKKMSIKKSFILITSGITSFSLIVGFIFLLGNSIKQNRDDLKNSSIKDVEFLSDYMSAPIIENNFEQAERFLLNFKMIPEIHKAYIFDVNGNVFAQYHDEIRKVIFVPNLTDSAEFFESGYLHVFRSIYYNGKKLGTIYLAVSTEKIVDEAWNDVFMFSGMILVLLIFTVLLTYMLLKKITNPIINLADVMSGMRGGNDFKIRVENSQQNEIGTLYSGFNEMLDKIEEDQNQLRKSEDLFKSIFNAVNDAIIMYDIELEKIVNVNKTFIEMFGLSETDVSKINIGSLCFEKSTDVKNEINNRIYASINEGEQNFECPAKRKSGEKFWCEINMRRITIGGFDSILIVMRDIDERKRTEEELKLTRFTVDKAGDSIYWIDEDGKFIDFNETACKMLGYSREEMLKFTIADIDPDFSMNLWPALWNEIKSTKYSKLLRTHQAKDGKIIPVEVVSNTIKYGAREINCAFVRDITERKNAEYELTRAKNYISNIIDSMPSIMIGVDSDLKVTFWNLKASKETGLQPAEAIGKKLEYLYPRFENELANIRKAIDERQIQRMQAVPTQLDKGIIYEDITIFPLVANGVEGAVIRIDDKTEQKRLEEIMIQSEKMLSIGGLAAGMAHEINNPLAGILQSAEILKRRLTDADLKTNQIAAEKVGLNFNSLKEYLTLRDSITLLDNIHNSGKRAAEIVKNMLNFARKSEVSFSSVSIPNLIEETIKLVQTDYNLKKKYDFKQIKFIKEYDENLPLVLCESSKIQQVLLNLLKNGAEAMGEHGTYDGGSMKFVFKVRDVDNYVRIEIEDNGIGMNEETRKRVFEPFFTTKAVGKGTGLGLSVSYFIIVENHGGTINVESENGRGTKFIIQLKKGNSNSI